MFHGIFAYLLHGQRVFLCSAGMVQINTMRYFNDLGTRFSGRGDAPLLTMVFMKNGRTRRMVVPANPNTSAQTAQKAVFTQLSEQWGALTDPQRDVWDSAASSGEWKITDSLTGTQNNPTSGFELYKHLNGIIAVVNGDASSSLDAPATKEAAGTALLDSVTIDASGGTVAIVYSGALGINEALNFKMSRPLPAGRMKLRLSTLRQVGVPQSGVSPLAIGAAYVAKFGAITGEAGKKVFYLIEAYNNATGQSRSVGSGDTIIVA